MSVVRFRDAVNSDEQDNVPNDFRGSAMDFGLDSCSNVSSHSSLPADMDSSLHQKHSSSRLKPSDQPSNKQSSISGSSKDVVGSKSHPNRNFANISMDEINKMIDERVQQVPITPFNSLLIY